MKRAPFFEIHVPKIMEDFIQGKTSDEKNLFEFCDFIDTREDCNDFRMISLQRLYLQYHDLLSKEAKERIKQTILNFRYWMSEPGHDNMCYWSENHQLLFASIEYIGASLFKDDLFTNENKYGKDKIAYAKQRIHHWFETRFHTGFIEWHSHVYYAEDLAALMHLIDFSEDKEISKKATIITDILFFDMASHSYKGNFALTHGRSYEKQKKQPKEADITPIIRDAFEFGNVYYQPTHIHSIFKYRLNYHVPEIIKQIAHDENEVIIKDSMGYDLKDVKNELNLKDELDRNILWQMEAFTNKESIEHTIDMLNEYEMYDNDFLSDFKSISHPLLRKLKLLPLVSIILNPFTNGVAIQRANTYTYKTKHYSLSTAQNHHPGECGDQQHIMNLCINEDVNLFITHPTIISYSEENEYLSLSPNEWVGNGRMPHSVQDKNINISIFRLPKKPTFMEKTMLHYTHAYFPTHLFDEYEVSNNYAFIKVGKVLVAFIGKNDLELKENDELIQKGQDTIWITEVSTTEKESYQTFKDRIKNNKIMTTNKTVHYESIEKQFYLHYKKDFFVNGNKVNLNYDRFDTPYIRAKRYSDEYKINYLNKTLVLNLNKCMREEV